MMSYKVMYNPESPYNPNGRYCLQEVQSREDAIIAAEEYGKMYFGEISPVWVLDGRKKIHVVPAGRTQ